MTLFSIQVTCRDVEQQLLASDPTSDSQLQRVRQLFQRQLLVPLAQGPSTLQAYKAWEASLPHGQQVCHLLCVEEACQLITSACPVYVQRVPTSVQCTNRCLRSGPHARIGIGSRRRVQLAQQAQWMSVM